MKTMEEWLSNWHSTEHRGIGHHQDMDTLSMLITGWIIFIFISLALVKYIYYRFVKKTPFGDFDAKEEVVSVTASEINKPKRKHLPAKSESIDDQQDPTICTGPDPIVVDFINGLQAYAFAEGRSWVEVKESLLSSLNQNLKEEDTAEDSLKISIVNFALKEKLKLTNIFAECSHPNNVKVTADCEMQISGEAAVSSKEVQPQRVKFFVDKISGRMSALLDTEAKSAVMKLDGWPEICVAVARSPSNPLKSSIRDTIGERIASVIRNTVAEIDTSSLADFPSAPKFSPKRSKSLEGFEANRTLVVKIVRAKELGSQKGCQQPYCVVSLDDPPVKFHTEIVKSSDPVWNENFTFNVMPSGGELLFEVFDKVGAKFLGCTIVSVDEIGAAKSKRLILKSRRMEISDQYSGVLHVQFSLTSGEESSLRPNDIPGRNKGVVKTTRSVFTRSPDSKSSTFAQNVIKEIERSVVPNASKSTLIIHGVQRDCLVPSEPCPKVFVVKECANGDDNSIGNDGQYGEERGRRKTRKGDIFTSIRRRFSKGRSQSVAIEGVETCGDEKEGVEVGGGGLPRSISADRNSMASARLGSGLGSARSSTSELSGISGFSTSTFVHENSTLVIESVENRVRKYYLVPPQLAETGKWKKKGKKLHIYNDHSFVAKHLPSGTMCEICALRLPFSIGKQGYVCRDCKMTCHKECHVRAPSFCPKTTIYDIELSTAKAVDTKDDKKGPLRRRSLLSFFRTEPKSNPEGQIEPAEKSQKKHKNKKRNIFRKGSRLGKIPEDEKENLSSKEQLTGTEIKDEEQLNDDQKKEENPVETKSEQEQKEETNEEQQIETEVKKEACPQPTSDNTSTTASTA